MDMDISGKLKIQLAIGSGSADVNGSGAYKVNDDATNKTHSMILTFKQVTYIEEVRAESYTNNENEFQDYKVFKFAAKSRDQVTHVVTYIEYGSVLHIELEYTG